MAQLRSWFNMATNPISPRVTNPSPPQEEDSPDENGLRIGERVVFLGGVNDQRATVRWIGKIDALSKDDKSVGIELDQPNGTTDGMFGGERLFNAKPHHGLIVSILNLIRDADYNVMDTSAPNTVPSKSNPGQQNGNMDGLSFILQKHKEKTTRVNTNQQNMALPASSGAILKRRIASSSETNIRQSKVTKGNGLAPIDDDCVVISDGEDDESEICDPVDPTVVNGPMQSVIANKCLHELERAILTGNEEQAGMLARRLAIYKLNLTIRRQMAQPVPRSDAIKINMYVEDRVAQQGPIPIVVSSNMTILNLKEKIWYDFEVPMKQQTWIIGKELASIDTNTLAHYGIEHPGVPVHLYIQESKDSNENVTGQAARFDAQKRMMDNLVSLQNVPPLQPRVAAYNVKVERQREQSPVRMQSPTPVGWVCAACTFVNKPTRPGCEVCSSPRPADYVIPVGYEMDEDERTAREHQARLEREFSEEQEALREKDYQLMIALEYSNVVRNMEPFECPVCFAEVAVGKGIRLKECFHELCEECVVNSVQHCEDAIVRCPCADPPCDSAFQECEIKAVVSPAMFEEYLKRSERAAEREADNAFHCRTSDCPGWCLYEDDANEFRCVACGKTNCITCSAIHEGMDCKQYQEKLEWDAPNNEDARKTRDAIVQMLEKGDAMKCPKCNIIIMKKAGCDWMMCSMCKCEICWCTKGPRWGPNGNGDTSGGCQCRLNGKPCHPQCGNCH